MTAPRTTEAPRHRAHLLALGIVLWALCIGCRREERPFQDVAEVSVQSQFPAESSLMPGQPPGRPPEYSPFQDNAWGIAEGKRLFTQFNCVGCHANGGGGMGPALMDDLWIYGNHPANIFETIVGGRPNGMPAWKGKIPDQQVWQLVAYIQSMNGQSSLDSLPGRSDHLRYSTPENARRPASPVQTGPR